MGHQERHRAENEKRIAQERRDRWLRPLKGVAGFFVGLTAFLWLPFWGGLQCYLNNEFPWD